MVHIMHDYKRTIAIFLLIGTLLFSSCTASTSTSTTEVQQPSAGELQIAYLDVGQGDSSFIHLPDGESILIDAGNPENGQEIVQYIQGTGEDTLDYVIATHPHADHIGGMAEVIQAFEVENVYMPEVSHTSQTYGNLLDTIEAEGLTTLTAKAGEVLFDDGTLRAEFLAPISDSYSGLNNYSAVLKLSYGDKAFLFMGDAEGEVEREILESGADISADVLKVGHHGSDTSSTREFIEAVEPSYTIISVGEGNSYGHPSSATLETLSDIGADIWRTDEKGNIVVTCDGEDIAIYNTDMPVQAQESQGEPTETELSEEAGEGITVYITKTGKRYHRDGCRYLAESRIPVLLEDLDTKKYTPCAVCHPPVK